MDNVIKFVSDKRSILVDIAVVVVAFVAIRIGDAQLGYALGAVCAIVVIEVMMAALMHGVELWLHGLLVLAQILAGVLLDKTVLSLLCVAVYVIMTLLQQIPGIRKS
ncbi:MAG: hypothetical protein LIO37_01145 [Clostridiales bacterium]|nr:hypothetical protein [Clostridiales bacterium]